jgi:hypothetical protein
MSLKYDIAKNWNIMYRVGYDQYSDNNYYNQNRGGVDGGNDFVLGLHRTVNGYNTIWDHSLITDYNAELGSNWRLNLTAGANSQERIYEQNGQRSTQQLVYGLFDHDNFIVHDNLTEDGSRIDFKSQFLSLGVFAQANLAFKEYLYLTLGGRNSWTSNLEEENRSLFYPSATVSFLPTAAFEGLKNSRAINFLKLRAGYSTSANFGFPYSTRAVLNINTNTFVDRAGTILNSNSISNRLANPDLKPELLQEIEAGVEGRFFNNRFNLDFTYYNRDSKDQILDRELDPSTGFTVTSINAGSVRNYGYEIAAGVNIVRTRDWNWQVDVNYFQNRNKVSLPADIKQIVTGGFTDEGTFAIDGKPLGIIQGYYFIRDSGSTAVSASGKETGAYIVDNNGNYIPSTGIGILGDPNPDFKMAAISTLSYKGLSFRMQWDYTQGGDIISYSSGSVIGRGLSKDTDFDRQQMLILPGVKQDGTPNDIMTSASQAYFTNLSGFFATDVIVYDATVIRLRELSLSYAVPASVLSKSPFGSLSVTFSGQNLWYNAPNTPEYVNLDPETNSLGVGNNRGLEYLTGPTSKRYGVSVRVTF